MSNPLLRGSSSLALVAGLVLALASSSAVAQGAAGSASDVKLTVAGNSAARTVLTYDIRDFQRQSVLIDGVEHTALSIESAGVLHMEEVGHPRLPVLANSVLIPDNSRMRARVVDTDYYDIEGIRLAPHRGIILRTQDPASVPYTFGPEYTRDAFFPEDVVSLREPYIMHDVRGQVVEVAPLQYNPVTQTLRVHTRIEIEVTEAGLGLVNAINRATAPYRASYSWEQLYRGHFCNYAAARSNAGLSITALEDGDMLIISHGPFIAAMQPLVTWKNSIGLTTTIVDVATIGNNATSIGNYIDAAYNTGNLSYVLLVGDASQVATASYTSAESDPTYSTVTADWYPDVFVGRFSAQTTAHVDTQVQRTIEYEQAGHHTGMGGWNAKGMGIGSSEGVGIGHYGEGDWQHQDLIRGELLAAGFTGVDQVYEPSATVTQVINGLNDGRRCVHYTGHGYTYGWGTTGFDTGDIDGLTNVGKLPFVHSVACLGGDFSGTTSFGEAWLRATYNGQPTGAIAAYCSSVNQSWDPPMYGQGNHSIGGQLGAVERFWTEANWSVGGCWYGGSSTMMDIVGSGGRDMFMTWHIFGDPSVRLIEEPPLTVSVIGGVPERMPPGAAADFTVKILNGTEQYVAGSGKLFCRLQGGSYTEIALSSLGGGLYQGALPHTTPGDTPEFYFSASGDGGSTVYQPSNAPTTAYSFDVCFETVALEETFSSDPGWTTQGQWAFGVPTGGGGAYGFPDPTSGHTGSNVYGYNLNGDYASNLPQRHLTSGAFDFSNVDGAQLSFWRWLNVETPTYDHAYLKISTDGTTFTNLWENQSEVADSAWTLVSYDISAIADGQPTVYFRWTMGVTDGSWEFSGWNIDDVTVLGYDFDPSLYALDYSLSAATGGAIDLRLDAGATHGGKTYLMLGSLSGTSPGFDAAGLHVPLNWDDFSNLSLLWSGTPYFQNFFGTLDGAGKASATFNTQGPLDPAFVGIEASFAFATLPPGDFISNPVTVTIEN